MQLQKHKTVQCNDGGSKVQLALTGASIACNVFDLFRVLALRFPKKLIPFDYNFPHFVSG